MKFSLNHQKLSKNQIVLFSKFAQILEKRILMISFDQIRTYSIIQMELSHINPKEKLFLNLSSHYKINNDSLFINKKKYLVKAIQEIKIKSMIKYRDESEKVLQNTKEGFKKIIELDRKRKIIKQSLKVYQTIPTSYEEKLYEICLVTLFIIFCFLLYYHP
ncbi:unnamed protein product [Paramecium sonneborni]|uniref:Uncharacterized protein n=1 Tax=Paramecium sonneborni TaxID=65129 RepID=A0A8S1QX04_9CILI|nr:unnamed protein product [Paramecium sonneborni]